MNTIITVPTYWSAAGGNDNSIYDHPTPIDEPLTLPALLESLIAAGAKDPIMVIAAVTTPEIAAVVMSRLNDIVAPYRSELAIVVIGADDTRVIHESAGSRGLPAKMVGVIGYGSVRNFQLILGAIFGADAIIALDDDETVPRGYLEQAQRFIGQNYDDTLITGIVGPYHEDFRDDCKGTQSGANPITERGEWIRSGITALTDATDELPVTPIGFGGNIVIHRDLFMHVPFDPAIPRGEDVDYIVTARMYGHLFRWDRKLFVYHHPPLQRRRSPCAMLRTDIARFVYMREKIKVAAQCGLASPGDLYPYPGRFLMDDLEDIAVAALAECSDVHSSARFISDQIAWARKAAPQFFRFCAQWDELMTTMRNDPVVTGHFAEKLNYSGG